jgi:hypothetical protein
MSKATYCADNLEDIAGDVVMVLEGHSSMLEFAATELRRLAAVEQELADLKAAMGEPVATIEGGKGRFLMWARGVLPHAFDVGTKLYVKAKP